MWFSSQDGQPGGRQHINLLWGSLCDLSSEILGVQVMEKDSVPVNQFYIDLNSYWSTNKPTYFIWI